MMSPEQFKQMVADIEAEREASMLSRKRHVDLLAQRVAKFLRGGDHLYALEPPFPSLLNLPSAERATYRRIARWIIDVQRRAIRGQCILCGCTDERACPDGCSWVDKDHTICSACADPMEF